MPADVPKVKPPLAGFPMLAKLFLAAFLALQVALAVERPRMWVSVASLCVRSVAVPWATAVAAAAPAAPAPA